MIRKAIFSVLILFCAVNVCAQDVYSIATQSSLNDLLSMMKNPSKNEELLVKMAFSFDPKYHQYIMPMIGRTYGISEKVRMMPGIVEWRRKLPTRIAPQLTEYAKEHLRYLNPVLYPFLMPEAWPEDTPLTEEDKNKEPYLPKVFQTTSSADMERIFPSSFDKNSLAEKILSDKVALPSQKKNVIGLSNADVGSVLSVMNKLKDLENGEEGRKRRNALMLDYQDTNLLLEAHVNPCRSLISRLHKIDADKWFEMQVAKENMDVETFINKCDATLKAYRMSIAKPGVTISVLNLAKEAKLLPKNSYRRQLNETIIRMFNTSKENVQAVKNFNEQLHKTFNEKILFFGTPLLLDF